MLVVHHLGNSQSERIVWLCEELGVPYEFVRHERDPQTMAAPPAYKALHPTGTAPIIQDGDLILAETGAIVDYIIHTYGGGRLTVAPGQPGYAEYLFWLHYPNGSMLPAAMMAMVGIMVGGADGQAAQMLRGRLDNAYAIVERRLGETPYLAGSELTAADIIAVFGLTTMRNNVPIDLAPFPNIRAYLARIGARPAYQRAMAKAEPDMAPRLS